MATYSRCIASGEHGDHGVEIAISKTCPCASDEKGNNICVERANISILSKDPRCITVGICDNTTDVYVSSVQALFLHSTTNHKKWWELFTSQVKSTCRFSKPVLLGIDDNC